MRENQQQTCSIYSIRVFDEPSQIGATAEGLRPEESQLHPLKCLQVSIQGSMRGRHVDNVINFGSREKLRSATEENGIMRYKETVNTLATSTLKAQQPALP